MASAMDPFDSLAGLSFSLQAVKPAAIVIVTTRAINRSCGVLEKLLCFHNLKIYKIIICIYFCCKYTK
jgi:hypothetical protein